MVDDTTFTVTLTRRSRSSRSPSATTRSSRCPRRSSTTRRPFGSSRSATARSRPTTEFVPGEGITLSATTTTRATTRPTVDSVEFRVYTDIDTAYTDLAGRQPRRRPPDPGRTRARPRRTSSATGYLEDVGLGVHLPRPPDLRRALRRQAGPPGPVDGHRPRGDRAAIFNGTRKPADVGRRRRSSTATATDACDVLPLRVAEAKALLDQAGFDRSQPVELWFNAGAGNDAWIEARRQPAAHEPRHRVRAAGRPASAGVRAAVRARA